jgi:hypothetical protein
LRVDSEARPQALSAGLVKTYLTRYVSKVNSGENESDFIANYFHRLLCVPISCVPFGLRKCEFPAEAAEADIDTVLHNENLIQLHSTIYFGTGY